MITASISVSSVACTRIASFAKTTASSSIRAWVRLFATAIPAAPVTPTTPPLIDMAICIISALASASTEISPPERTEASLSIYATVSFSKIITSPVMPTPTIAPPPEPEKETKSVSDSARNATDWVAASDVLSFTTASFSIKARDFDVVFCAIIVP